jgi:hypothetical protein
MHVNPSILFLVQISSVASRDEATHHLLACEMLYRAIVGPAQTDHPDIQAFLRGFQLPCRNGYRFTDVSVFLLLRTVQVHTCHLLVFPVYKTCGRRV